VSVAADPLDDAVARLRAGGLVAYPTETLYGVGVNARSEAAVEALRVFKGRAETQPLSILVTDAAELETLGCALGQSARRLVAAFWPGPLTLVLDCDTRFATGVAGPDGGVGVRCSPHPVARSLAARAAEAGVGPVTSTSLNRTGAPPARTRADARALCSNARGAAGGEPWLLDLPGSAEPGGIASTVVDARGSALRVLRPGAVTEAALRLALLASDEGGAR
jgi:L-threonylcarbamoyladenylate synthase